MRSLIATLLVVLILLPIITYFKTGTTSTELNTVELNVKEKQLHPVYFLGEPKNTPTMFNARSSSFKIIFDSAHGQYWDESQMTNFLSLLSMFGDVIINENPITGELLSDADLLIIPNPYPYRNGNFTSEELHAMWDFIENKSGSLFIMGDASWNITRGYDYVHPEILNPITARYGITWLHGEVKDNESNLNRPWYVLINQFTSDSQMILPGIQQVCFASGTSLNTTTPTVNASVYILARGNPTSFFINASGITQPHPRGEEIIPFIAAEINNGGRIFASGSSRMFSDKSDSGLLVEQNRDLAMLAIAWLLHYEIVPRSSIEKETIRFLEETNLRVYITNFASREISSSVYILLPYVLNLTSPNATVNNGTATYEVPILPNNTVFVDVPPHTTVEITFKVKSVIGVRYYGRILIRVFFEGKYLETSVSITNLPCFTVESYFENIYLNTSITNSTTLYVKITNNCSRTINNVTVEIIEIPTEFLIQPSNKTIILQKIDAEQTVVVVFKINITTIGVYTVTIQVSSPDGGIDVSRATLIAFPEKIVIFDNAHNQYFDYNKMTTLIQILREYAPVLISFEPISSTVLKFTRLLVIPNPEPTYGNDVFSDDEIVAIQNYIESGGALLIMGNYYRYFYLENPNNVNDITSKYGITWFDGDVYDDVNNINNRAYYVIVKNFANNSLARMLTEGIEDVYYSGTFLNFTEKPNVKLYPILLGNPTTYGTLGGSEEPHVVKGNETILMIAAIIKPSDGKIIATGSTYMFSDYGLNFMSHNKPFARKIIGWLLASTKMSLYISPLPLEIYTGEKYVIKCKISNDGVKDLVNIYVYISVSGPIILLNSTTNVSIPYLAPGEIIRFRWIVKATKPGSATIVITAKAGNYPPMTQMYTLSIREKPTPTPTWIYIAVGSILISIVIIAIVAWKKGVAFRRKI